MPIAATHARFAGKRSARITCKEDFKGMSAETARACILQLGSRNCLGRVSSVLGQFSARVAQFTPFVVGFGTLAALGACSRIAPVGKFFPTFRMRHEFLVGTRLITVLTRGHDKPPG